MLIKQRTVTVGNSVDGNHLTLTSNGQYTLHGTDKNDKIELRYERGHQQRPTVAIWVNGKLVDKVTEEQIKNLTINSKGGDDTITIDPLINAHIIINSGAGNDRITCNDINTRVNTGTGDDNVIIQKSLRSKSAGLFTNTRITSSGGADKIRWHSSQYQFSDSYYKFISTDKTSMAFINLTHRPVKV